MSSAFDALMATFASPMLDQHFGEPVSVTRGSTTTTGITASWESQGAEVATADGKHTATVDRFWFVKQSLYMISGDAVVPKTGDRITDDAGNVWEILPKKTTPSVESFAGGEYWKVATKQVT